MLRTGKQVWEATAKRRAIDLRREELDFHMQRYTVLITQASLLTGFAFESIVHIDVPPGTNDFWPAMFYCGLSASVMCSLYVVVVASSLVVFGYQLAILGADGDSLALAIEHLRARRFILFSTGGLALLGIVFAGIALAWMKMGPVAAYVTIGFVAFGFMAFVSVTRIFCAIGRRRLVTGMAQFITPECVPLALPSGSCDACIACSRHCAS